MTKLRLPTDSAVLGVTLTVPLITGDHVEGYDYKKLVKFFKKYHADKTFQNWFAGQTGAILEDDKGKPIFLVYKHDVDQFLQGGIPFD